MDRGTGANPRLPPQHSAGAQHPPQGVARQGSWHMHNERPQPVPDDGFEQVSFESTVQDWMQDGFESSWRNSTSTDGHLGMPAPSVRIPNYPAAIHTVPTGGTPMGTPPSAKGIAAELPFAAGHQEGPFGISDPSRTSISASSLPSDASGFAQEARYHAQRQQPSGLDSFGGFHQQASSQPATTGPEFGQAYESLLASELAQEQLHALAQQRRLERRASLVGNNQDAAAQTMQVNLGDIPGSLVKSGRPPLPSSTKAAAAAVQLPGSDHPQSPKDGTVMEHRMAGDLMLGKMNKSVKKSMVQIRSKKKGSHRSDGSARSRKSMANSDMQFNVGDEEQEHVKWYKNHKFWTAVASVLITEALLISAIVMVVFYKRHKVVWFEWWRWLFFFSGVMPIYWTSRAVIHVLVLTVETTAFTTRKAVYYTVGTRKPLRRFLRVALMTPLFVGCFYSKDFSNTNVRDVFKTLCRLLGCLLLFTFANVLKTLLAKIMASHFHKEAHFEKMQEALQKEYFLIALSQPRQEESSSSSSGSEEEEGDVTAELEHMDSPAARMYHKSMAFQQDQKRIREDVTKRKRSTFRIPHFLHRRHHRHLHSHHSHLGHTSTTTEFQRVASHDLHVSTHQTVSAPAETADGRSNGLPGVANGFADGRSNGFPDVAGTSAESARRSASQRKFAEQSADSQQPQINSRARNKAAPAANTSFKSAQGGGSSNPKSFRRSASKVQHPSGQASQEGGTSVMSKMKRSMTLLAGRPLSETGMTERSNRSVVKSHLDAIPEDRRAIEKGGGNAVQKLHEVEKYIRKNKLKVTFADTLGAAKHQEDSEVTSKNEAKKLAFYLFWNIKPSFNRTYILPEDLEHFLEPEKAQQAFDILDVDGDGQVTLHNIRDAVVSIYQERKHLAFTLKDTKTIVGKLERIAGFVIHILMFFFYLVIFDVDVTHLWTAVAAAIVAFSFIFKNAIATMFDSVIFLFVVHAFDVGDGILLNGDLHKVEEIALNMTVLKRWDGGRIWYPNSMINTVPILNVTRSENKWEFFKVFLDVGHPLGVFESIRAEVMKFLEDNPKSYSGKGQVINCSAGDPLKIQLGFFFEYAHCDTSKLGEERHRLFCKIAEVLCTQRVQYTFPGFGSGPNRPSGPALEALLPPRPPGPSGPPSPGRSTPPASPSSGWATLRQRTGLGSPSQPEGHPADRPGAAQTLRQASAGLQRGFGSNVSLPGLDAQGSGALQQELRAQQRNEEDMVRVQQMALNRGTSASGQGGPGLPSSTPLLMQQSQP
ncbi:hypothetical protein ABBQ32_010760 [Trebouxia sp. C0010 RCD-2024]